jgi:ATP-dependent RNA helicase RhlE
VSLAEVQVFILDEADRMLDMGFIRDIKRILKMLPQQRQNLMFSATYSDDIRQLANQFLRKPTFLQVTPSNATADKVEQSAYRVPKDHKRHLLAHLIIEGNWHQVLVFTRTKHGANRLTQQLERAGITAMAIHGNKSQNARERALEEFKEGKVRVLVATDIAARGLDIEALPHVVNYDLPHVAEDYVHRIGRTGRAGAEGEAVSLVSAEERSLMAAIERLMNRRVESRVIAGFETGSAPQRGAEPPVDRANGGRERQRNRNEGRSASTRRQAAAPGTVSSGGLGVAGPLSVAAACRAPRRLAASPAAGGQEPGARGADRRSAPPDARGRRAAGARAAQRSAPAAPSTGALCP